MDYKKINIINNFLTEDDIKYFIKEIDNLEESKQMEYRPNGRVRSWHTSIDSMDDIKDKYALKSIEAISKAYGLNYEIYLSDFAYFISLKDSYMHKHIDAGDEYSHFKYSAVIYLNEDFDGGELIFPNIGYTYEPKAGDIVFFPSDDDDYEHMVNLLKSGKRYVIGFWFSAV
ncbi:Oxoglutarate/iron-dependent dioxygenase [uncultured Caudovirales phage]|uniref:Oxoglutarate/iron-dependent dioxygenase n=1 Tax=uncultured Caudovirales phage TaxID=2100421 RepID=A0A6J7WNH1_9CAUD|nr:Oxoglutarate/iron-dependent dioxygenase [uncultured Caudovirales phage]